MERPLSGVERMMYLGSERSPANGFVCAHVRGPLDEAKLRLAIERLPRRHPMLSVRVLRKQGVLTFTTEAVPPIPLRILSDDGSGQTFLKVAAAEISTPFDLTTGPLARFTLVRHPDGERTDVIMTGDHAVADATAKLYVLRDLLTGDGSPEIAPVPLPPAVTHLFPAPILDAAPALVPPPNTGHQPTPLLSVSTSDIVITPAQLASEPMKMLARRCKEQGVTVHAALCVAFGASFAALSENKAKVFISSPINYRHRLEPVARETSSSSVAFATTHLDFSLPKSFWEQAHAVQQQLLEWKSDQKLFGFSSAIEEASQAEPDDSRFSQRSRQYMNSYDFSISNIGRQPIPTRYGDLTIEAVHACAIMPGEIVICLLTLDETMHITFATSGLSKAANDAARQMLASAISRLREC